MPYIDMNMSRSTPVAAPAALSTSTGVSASYGE